MDIKIREDRQDLRTFVLETLIRHEGYLDTRMYECADYLTSAGLTTAVSHIIQGWSDWKKENRSDGFHVKL